MIVKGYKAFNKGLKCLDFQYELGKDFVMEEQPILCKKGFHFCKNLSDVYSYYAFDTENTVVCEIEAVEKATTAIKVVSSDLSIAVSFKIRFNVQHNELQVK